MKPTLYLIDGTALLYRSYYAFIAKPLVNSKGQHTSAIFGVINSFLRLLELKEAEYIMISFDRKAPTFRHELSADYKATRPPMPEELVTQVEPVKEFFKLIGLKDISLDGYEADDVLATLAEKYKQDYQVVMVTADKDYSQLVDEDVSIWDPAKDQSYNEAGIKEKYGVRADQFIDYLALTGDASDNIPGVRGIGPKSAVELLNSFESVEAIYKNLEAVPPKYRKRLEGQQETALLSYQLATIVRDVPIESEPPQSFEVQDLKKALAFMDQYELFTLKRRILTRMAAAQEPEATIQSDIFADEPIQEQEPDAPDFIAKMATKDDLKRILAEIRTYAEVALDTETDSVDSMQANLVGISLAYRQNEAWYLPLAHQFHDNLPLKETLESLRAALDGKLIIGHNLKYDLIVLKRHGWTVDNPIFDTMLAAYVLDAGSASFSLDKCAQKELNHQMIEIKEIIGSGKSAITFDQADINKAYVYAAEDAWATLKLAPIYRRRLQFSSLDKLYDEIELPLIKTLAHMEMNGVCLDTAMLRELSRTINNRLSELTERIYDYAGYQFNINSTQQLAKLLFEEKALPTKKKTKSGFSTDSSVLEELAVDHEIAKELLEYRMLNKLDSTYVAALPALVNTETNKIHSNFNQTVASTGRLSSSNPNLQNIPIRTELGREIRKAFVPSAPGRVILAADYSQIELRLLALFSQDDTLLKAFAQNLDIHRQTAAIIYNTPVDNVSADQRREAKTINFGILYGMGQIKLSRELSITRNEAKEMIENYFERFPTIKSYINSSVDSARQQQFCSTLFGRKLYLPNITSANPGLKSEAERVAVNMPIQGSAADLIKIAMLEIDRQIKDNPQIKMILQVHDELVFDVEENVVEQASALIRKAMEDALPAQYREVIQLKTDIGIGKNWFEAH